jgi:phthalate 4,5-cis-dihydrodiol dehydrogenase
LVQPVVKIGVAGLGRAFTLMLPTFRADPRVRLVAAADPRREARDRFASEFDATAYDSVEALAGDANVAAIYVATPHQMHAEHVIAAAKGGKHVLVEKPIAITLDECRRMIAAAHDAKVHLVVGHSHSFNAPYLRTREIVESGTFGRLGMITALNFTDYMYRPRRPEELATEQGGGVLFSQGAHQIDIVRLIGGGLLRSVRAGAGIWDRARPTEGAYSALLTFEDGVYASLTYSGYAHFDSDEFCNWTAEMGLPKDRRRYGAARKALQGADIEREAALKASRNYGGSNYTEPPLPSGRLHQHFGLVVASCERADLRPMPEGVIVYGDFEQTLSDVPVRDVPRAEVIDELYDACMHDRRPLHSGEWAMATLEACLAVLQSSREGREIELEHQVALDVSTRSPA